MGKMERAPRIVSTKAVAPSELLVHFANGVVKSYDCCGLLGRPQFQRLRSAAFFRSVRVDPGGYGVSWNDDMDLSGIELWIKGKPLSNKT
jgi:hypothetical protein